MANIIGNRDIWTELLQTSALRVFASQQTNQWTFEQMARTGAAIRSSREAMRKSDEFLQRITPISR